MSHDGRGLKGDGRRSPPSHLPPPPHQFVLGSGNDASSARDSSGRSGGRFPVGALAPGMVYSQPTSNQHPGSFIVSLNGAPHYLSFPLPIAPPTDLSKSSPK